MQVEAAKLRLADVVRLAGDGEREISKIEKNGDVRVWFRGDDLEQPATRVAELGEVFEIQRPGDLFVAPKPPKDIPEARARIFERMAALGWTVIPPGVRGINAYVTDPTDTVRIKLKSQAVALQVRWFEKGSWRWHPNPRSLGQIKAFATNLDEEVPKLIRVARERAQKRYEADQARIAREPEVAANARLAIDAAEAVVVRYALDQGVLLGGATKQHKDLIKALANPYRFKYSRNLPGDAAWYVPRSRGTYQPRSRVEQLAEALRRRGVPVVVEYTEAANDAPREPEVEPASETQLEPDESGRKAGRPPDNGKRAERLRTLAEKMAANANAKINAERQENTPRRARMAGGIRDEARRALVMAETIRLAADAVERGELEYVARIGTAAEVEALDLQLRRGVWERNRRESRRLDEPNREPEDGDIDFTTFPDVVAYSDGLRMTVEASSDLPGIADARRRIERLSKRDSNERLVLGPEDVDALRQLITAIRRDDARKMPLATSVLDDEIKTVDRLGRIGVRDTATLRAALREYKQCCRGRVEKKREDPIAAKKRELQFAKIPGYFPTPRPLAERLVEAAEIGPGDRVLEPSAGSGSIAEVIRDRHPDASLELVERNHSLREILEASGFRLVGYDFLAFDPTHKYSRIIMNPPFENRQDVEHIQHALRMLEPGGRLVAIASAGLGFRDDAATAGLREWIKKRGGRIEALPEQSFQESGTNVNTVMVVIDTPRETMAVKVPVVIPPQPVPTTKPKRSPLAERWTRHITRRVHDTGLWENLAKTSCFVRKEGDVSVTLCPAIQKHVVGDCPPSDAGVKSKNKQLMLCQVDEEVEYFRGFTPGIQQAKAEAENRLARGRVRLGQTSVVPPLPAVDDFERQERYLDAIIPSRVVYTRDAPLSPIWVDLAEPHVVLPDGSTQALGVWEGELSENPTYRLRVRAGKDQTVDEFIARLGKELIPYRGPVGPSTLAKVLALVSNDARMKLVTAGVTMHDIQHGHFSGQTVYWLRSPDDSETFGPITASGDLVKNQSVLAEFNRRQHGEQSQPLPTLPPGWTLDDTIVAALLLKGRRFWVAWQPSTENFTTKGEGNEWANFETLPKRAPFDADKGYVDFVNRFSWTMTRQLEETPRTVHFRVAGPWLGAVFPTDFGKRITFDPPTGGTLDVAELEQAYAEVLEVAQADPEHILAKHWLKLMQQRIAWAKAWLRKQGEAERKAQAEIKDKEKADMRAKKAAKKKDAAEKLTAKKSAAKKAPKKAAAKKATSAGKKTVEKAAKKTNGKKVAKKATNGRAPKVNGAASAKVNGAAPAKVNGAAPVDGVAPISNGNAAPARVNGAASAKVSGATPARLNGAASKPNGAASQGSAPKINGSTNGSAAHDGHAEHQRHLVFRRNDLVRFRKRSQIAKGLGINQDTLYTVEMVTTHEGRPVVVLRHGKGRHLALMKIPPGHLAVVQRADQIPNEILACAARLAQYEGPISPKTRRMLAELARRS